MKFERIIKVIGYVNNAHGGFSMLLGWAQTLVYTM